MLHRVIPIGLFPLLLLGACSDPSPGTRSGGERSIEATQTAAPAAQVGTPAASTPPMRWPVGEETITGDTPITSENYAKVMEARSREYEALEYKPVNLSSFECGDNCYLEITEAIEGAAERKVLCTARLCANWQADGRLPSNLRNTGAEAKFGKANQVDGAGTVMARDVEAIVDLRLVRR